MPTFTRVVIDPGHGHSNSYGSFDAGIMVGRLHEVSLIDEISEDICSVLAREMIAYECLPTRKKPGMSPVERGAFAQEQARTLQISLHFGTAKQLSLNGGHIYVRGSKEHPICSILGDVVEKWGATTCKNFAGVKTCAATYDWLPEHDAEIGVLGVHLEPFCLNGIDAIVYAGRLRPLGTELGEVLVSYLRGQNPALGRERTQVWSNGPDGREVFGG